MKFQHIGFLALAALSLVSCEEWGGKKPHVTTPYVLQIPTGMPQPALPEDNPLTVEGIYSVANSFMIPSFPSTVARAVRPATTRPLDLQTTDPPLVQG